MKYLLLIALLVVGLTKINAQEKLPWLRVDGEKIINELGQTVVLRGINLGGWLVEEPWLLPFKTHPPKNSPYTQIKDRVSLWKVFLSRFGAVQTKRIQSAFRNAWLTEGDFARIKATGLNCVRLPFTYDLLEESNGLFPWLDWAIATASKYGIYVILDMHGAPGRQSGEQHTGEEKCNRLFSDPTMIKKTIEVWEKIVERYKDLPTVVGYDLLNEPMGAPNIVTLYLVQDQIYRAIRACDPKHIIFIEDGFTGIDRMPNPSVVGWQNVVFSTHAFTHKNNSKDEFTLGLEKLMATITTQQTLFKTPMYIGEFNFEPYGKADKIKEFINILQSKDISWSLWTYKIAGDGRGSFWGLYSHTKKMKKIDPFQDSRDEILKKINQLRTENFVENIALTKVLQSTS